MKIVTYNIHSGKDSSNNETLTEIATYLKQGNYDIMCLQEVKYEHYKKMKSILKINGAFVANVNRPDLLYGVCIFSKYYIEDNTHVPLSSKKEQRGLLSVTLNVDGECVNVINTHLGLDKKEREIQISEMLDFTNRLRDRVIVCGDFNDKNINLSTFSDCAVMCNKYHIPTFEKTMARIDYIFVSEKVSVKDYHVDNIKLSDHYPVIGIL